jgi:hypothetical protein
MARMGWLAVAMAVAMAALASGCASEWKIHGGPAECVQICQSWNMRLTGMVAVGDQSRRGGGASACVCEIPTSGGQVAAGASGMAASTGAIAVMLAQQARQQQQQQQARY